MSTPSNLEDHLGYWLRLASNQVSAAFARSLEQHQLSVAEWVAMRHLYDQGQISSSHLADLLSMTRGAISKILDKLEEKDLAVRAPNPDDKRSQLVSLSSKGRLLLPDLARLADQNDEHYFAVLDQTDQENLRRILEQLSHLHGWKQPPTD